MPEGMGIRREKREREGQKTEDRRHGDIGHRAEDRRFQKTEDRRQKTEDRRQKTEDREDVGG